MTEDDPTGGEIDGNSATRRREQAAQRDRHKAEQAAAAHEVQAERAAEAAEVQAAEDRAKAARKR